MTKSIGDVLSQNVTDFELKGVTLKFKKLTLGVLIELESKGIDIQSLDDEDITIGKKITIAGNLLWVLLCDDSRNFVETKENFFQLFDNFGDIENIMAIVTDNAISKNEDSKKN